MQHSEASTEEILGIIKRVIERENREVAADEKRKRESMGFAPAMRAAAPDETDQVTLACGDNGDVLDLGEAELVIDDERAADVADHHDASADSEEDAAMDEPEALTSNAARQSVNDSFAALAKLANGEASKANAPSESPLEGMVREMLRPMLARWLDENLPTVVEQLVREEIDRISGKSR